MYTFPVLGIYKLCVSSFVVEFSLSLHGDGETPLGFLVNADDFMAIEL